MPPRKRTQAKPTPPKLTPEQATASVFGAPRPVARPVTHISYSGMNTYQECAKKYELSYITQAPKGGAVWFVGGLAVHRATEEWDRAQVADTSLDLPTVWRKVFNEELEKQRAKDPDQLNWRKGGVKADNPQGEDIAHWYSVLGPSLVESYLAWRKRSSWEISIGSSPMDRPALRMPRPEAKAPSRSPSWPFLRPSSFTLARLLRGRTTPSRPRSAALLVMCQRIGWTYA